MGTPDFAVFTLQALVERGENVIGVVTQTDKPRGRGYELLPTPVKKYALEHGIPVYQPKTLRSEEFAAQLAEIDPELIIVVAYGKLLPRYVLEYPKYGCVNAHGSILPKYRGAAPMQRAVMCGEKETGVTVMYMAEGLDTGDIITQSVFAIEPDDDFEDIHDRSAEIGGRLLVDTIPTIFDGTATRTPQDDSLATYAAKIEKSDAKIDFTLPAATLDCIIRGVTPIPGAYAYKDGKMLKIFNATPVAKANGTPGEVIDVDAKGEGSFTVACGTGALVVRGVIPEGKGRMTAGDFVRGRKIQIGDVLS